eukprot:3604855-Prorocentrum_lima.AAC.1
MPSPQEATMSRLGATYDVGPLATVGHMTPGDTVRPKYFPSKGAPNTGPVSQPSSSAAASASPSGSSSQHIRPRVPKAKGS